MIIEIDEKTIDLNSFLTLEKLTLTEIEREIAKNYKGNIEILDDPSKWICIIQDIPRY